MPDGNLPDFSAELYKSLEGIAADILPDRIFTMGAYGFDGHVDHIATHDSALHVVEGLRKAGHGVITLDLMHDHGGEYLVSGNLFRKLGAMAMHVSQTVEPDLLRWGGTDFYRQIILGPEIYHQSIL